MAPEDKIRNDLESLEDALRDLAPAPPRMSAGQTMYLAGQQAARREQRRQRFWPACTAALAVACATMGALLARQGEPRVVYVPVPSQEAEPDQDQPHPNDSAPSEPDHNRGHQSTPAEPRHELAMAESHWPVVGSGQSWQQLLDQWLDESATEGADTRERASAGPTESTLIATVHSGDWPALLPGQTAGERFRALASPLRQEPGTAMRNLTALFSSRGL